MSGKKSYLNTGTNVTGSFLRVRRYEVPGDATQELYDGFNTWSAGLATHSIHAAYALVAANWAVHGSADAILTNPWAKASLAIVIGLLGFNLLCMGYMTWLYKRRCMYADNDKERWAKEFEDASKRKSAWPYTNLIQYLGECLRLLRIFAPTAAGFFFILSLFL